MREMILAADEAGVKALLPGGVYPDNPFSGAVSTVAWGAAPATEGDLGFSTTTWRGVAAAPPDTTAPVVSAVRVRQDALTIASAGSTAPVFTPNGDLKHLPKGSTPIDFATARTCLRSAEPSSSGGVPTAMNWNKPWSTPF